jgi:hypothetical protein
MPTTIETDKIAKIKALITGALTGIKEAADILCGLIDEDPTIIDTLVESGQFQRSFLRSLESVGRNQLRPELFFAETPGHRALRKLNYSEQSRFLTKPLTVLVLKDGDITDTLEVSVENLTIDQTRQVFGPAGIRDKASQRAWIEGARMSQIAPKKSTVPYKVVGKKVHITETCTLDANALLDILKDLQR